MCRMVGLAFKGDFPMHVLADLRLVAEIGKVPDQGEEVDGHRDGWGMVSFSLGDPFYLGRSPRPIHMDPSFDSAKKGICELERPNLLICHARRGSKGQVSLQNSHPFIMDGIVFAHNGGVDGLRAETEHQPRGDTDSERVFMMFLDRYADTKDVPLALKSTLEEEVHHHAFTGLIFLISDGKRLYGYREVGEGKDCNYYNLKYIQCEDYVLMLQEAQSIESAVAEQVANRELVSVDHSLKIERKMLF